MARSRRRRKALPVLHCPVVFIEREPQPLHPWELACLNWLAEQYAARYGDTPEVTAARRAALMKGP